MNVSGHWAGQIETPLTSTGIKQAQDAGKLLKEMTPKIDVIIASPLSRAHDTASYIAKEIGYPVDKIIKDKLFIERSFGDLEGTSHEYFIKNKTMKDMDEMPGAEAALVLHNRAVKAMEYLKSLPEKNILVVSHGSFGRALMRVAEDIPYHFEYDDSHREKYRIGNAEIIEIY